MKTISNKTDERKDRFLPIFVGNNGTILKNDTSKSISGLTVHLNAIFFLPDNQTGFIAGNSGTILKTADGGETWKIMKPFPDGSETNWVTYLYSPSL